LTSLDHGLPCISVPILHFSAAGRVSHIALFVMEQGAGVYKTYAAYQRGIAP
jgi:hypothetical protein